MLVYRSTVAAAIFAGALLVGCAAPDQPTDLRQDGPPNVTTVTVMSDLKTAIDPSPPRLSRLLEMATFCRLNDEKRPGLVNLPDVSTYQVCPEEIADKAPSEGVVEGSPPNWFARVVFDKLLDPSIEDLIPLDPMMPDGTQIGTFVNTQPVTLRCNGVDVPYNGYYVPNGNRVSWPLGPALFVQPLSALSVPTGAACEIGIKDIVHNKSGESVPADQRSYTFKIAPMVLRFSNPDPTDGDNGDIELTPDSPVQFYWTAAFTGTPIVDPAEIRIFEGPNLNAGADPDPAVCNGGGTAVDSMDIVTSARGTGAATTALVMNLILANPDPDPLAPPVWKPTTTYRVEFGPNAKVTPQQGGAAGTFPAGYKLCFHTTAAL
jgi:hypothetical protein